MNQEEIKSTMLKHLQQEKQLLLSDAVSALKIPLIQMQWAAKVLEQDGYITSEKTDKGKVLTLVEKKSGTKSKVEPVKTEKKEVVEKIEAPKRKIKTGRDNTRYVFESSAPLPKGQCVLSILKAYVRDHKPTLKDFKATWDDAIVQRYGITQELNNAKALSGDRDRYFMKEAQILKTKDGKKLACTSQWTTERLEAFLQIARKLKYTVKAVA